MKEKLVKLLKGLGLCLLIVGVVVISIRLFTVVRTLSSKELINQKLLPETFRERMEQEGDKHRMKMLKGEVGRMLHWIDDMKKSIQYLEKKSQPLQLERILLLREEVDELANKVDGVKALSQQQLKEMPDFGIKLSSIYGEFYEIQARIEKLKKETPAPAPAALAPD